MKYSLILCAAISSSAFGMQPEMTPNYFQDMPYKQFTALWDANIAARKEFYKKYRSDARKNPELQQEAAHLEGMRLAIMNAITQGAVCIPKK